MALFRRPTSPFWWMRLERPGQAPLRKSTGVYVKAATPAQSKDNEALAFSIYHASMADLARKRFKLPTTTVRTLAQQAAWYQRHHTPTHRGARQESQRIDHLVAALGSCALAELTPSRWSEYKAARLKAVSLNTVGNELTILKLIMASAIPDWIEYSPLAGVKRKKEKLPAKRTITKAEEPAFLKALKREDLELHDLYVVGVGTLLRQDALLNLQRREHRGASLALMTKTGPHEIPLTGPTPLQVRAAKVLAQRLPTTADGYFFPEWQQYFASFDDPGHPRVQFLRLVRRAATASKIPWGIRAGGIVWHTATRATGATRMLRDYQIDIRTVQMVGGWESLDQMMDYLGVDQSVFPAGHTTGHTVSQKRRSA
jgi:integrase